MLAIVLVAGAGVVGYFIGFTAAGRDAAFDRGQRTGHSAGMKEGVETGFLEGESDALARFGPGTPGYKRIYKKGRRAGMAAGHAAGYSAGSSDAFARFDGGWEIGGWYIVHFGQPIGDEEYLIESRVPMETGESYNIYRDDADEICGGSLF